MPAVVLRNTMANLMLPTAEASDSHLGTIQLHDHQLEGIERIVRSLQTFHGALLCDEVGLGKTFTAAGVIQRFRSSVVVAPAALIPMWAEALHLAKVSTTLLSIEKFSRNPVPSITAELVVVDEAHHFRNIRTKRFANLSRFIGHGRALLLTATPVHNSRSDLIALLSLFLGSRANTLNAVEFAECVIRRERRIIGKAFPSRMQLPAQIVPCSESIRSAILSLPPPIPASDGEDCATLVQFTLLRQWASSDAALLAGLANRLARARALLQALDAGRYPTRAELKAWLTGGMDIQLGFPEFLAHGTGAPELLEAVRRHEEATLNLYHLVRSGASSDERRAQYLLLLRATYPERRIIAFTQFASTARHLFSLVRKRPAVALVTARRCEIASGPVPREFVIKRFAPNATGLKAPSAREDISLLIATDLCSEGLNLQDATVLVHLDTPWTPARVEQRVGRIARPGGPSPEIFIHSIIVPAIAEDILRMAERLRQKSDAAAAAVGKDSGDISGPVIPPSVPEASESIIRLLSFWKSDPLFTGPAKHVASEVAATMDCFIAVVTDGKSNSLLCGSAGRVSNDPRRILSHIEALTADNISSDDDNFSPALEAIRHWSEQETLEDALGVRRNQAPGRRRIARQIGFVTSRFPLQLRVTASVLADAARNAVVVDCNAGGEERIALLEKSVGRGDTWLREVGEFGSSFGNEKAEPTNGSGFEVLALLIGRKR